MRINEKWEMGNEEMGKWEEGIHCTSLNKLWMFCDSSNVMRESMSICALTERPQLAPKVYATALHHCLLVAMFLTFGILSS